MTGHVNIALFVPHAGCPHQCCFCNQRSISGRTAALEPEDVRTAVLTALDGRESMDAEIAFFGGSFTAVDREYMLRLLDSTREFVSSGRVSGIRISTRPDAVDREALDILKSYSVSAVELGCQSMSDRVLELCSRGHTSEDIVNACALIKEYGFSLGVQMMTGLPGDDDEACMETAKRLIALEPDTCRIYPTVVLKDTPLADLYNSGLYTPQTLDGAVKLCSRLLLLFYEAGIPVIRLGLHSGGGVEGGYIAGAYHPAFRELCEGEIFFEKTVKLLRGAQKASAVYVPRGKTSQAVGHSRRNLKRLGEMGYDLTVRESDGLSGYNIRIE